MDSNPKIGKYIANNFSGIQHCLTLLVMSSAQYLHLLGVTLAFSAAMAEPIYGCGAPWQPMDILPTLFVCG